MRCLVWNRVESLVHLKSSFNTLYKTKKDRKTQHSNRDPKGIPLSPVPSIVPELRDGSRLWLIKPLFQAHQFVAPVNKICSTTIGREHCDSIE